MGSTSPSRCGRNRSRRSDDATLSWSSVMYDGCSASWRKLRSRRLMLTWSVPMSAAVTLSPSCPAYPGLSTTPVRRTSSTHSSSESVFVIGPPVPFPSSRTRRMPSASSCAAAQEVVLDLGPQRVELVEVHAHLGEPGVARVAGVHRRAVEVEVVLVAPDADEELQVALRAPPLVPPA